MRDIKTQSKRGKKSVAHCNLNFIKLLTDYRKNPKQFKKLVKHCSNKEVDAITEIIFNFLRGHLRCDRKKYKKQANFLRLVGNKQKSNKQRRKAILSKGNGIIPLLSVAVPALIALFGGK